MRVHVKGGGTINFTQQDYLGQGGEGMVYVKGSEAYKVYHDPAKMIPMGKIQALSVISDANVIKPTKVLLDGKGLPIGYSMRFVSGTHALCQVLTPAYRKREGLSPQQMLTLVQQMQKSIQKIHDAGVLIVDLNEMNFLVSGDHKEIYFIDVDSYQTPSYPATALMESVRDWSVKGHDFTSLSDWYSFAVISFQMFTGVHPFMGRYKGTESKYKTKLPTDAPDDVFAVTRRRMQDGISVLRSDVGVPSVCFGFDVIPPAYMAWYKALFNEGKRLPPPTDLHAPLVLNPVVRQVVSGQKLHITELFKFDAHVTGVWSSYGTTVVATTDGMWVNGRRVGDYKHVRGVGFTPQGHKAICASLDGQKVVLYDTSDKKEIPFGLNATDIMSYGGRIYLKGASYICEVVLTDLGDGQVIATPKPVASIMEHATLLFPGVAIQDMLGSTFLSLFPSAGTSYQVRVKELDGYTIADAKFDNGVLMVTGVRKKKYYDTFLFRFDTADYSTYDVRKVDLNSSFRFVTLDSGICLSLTDDDKLEVFSARKGSTAVKEVEDPALEDVMLAKSDGQALFYTERAVYQMSLR